MEKVSAVARQLKAMRQEAGLTVQAIADALDMPKSTYASNEDKFKRPYFPMDFVKRLLPIFTTRDIAENRVLSLAGAGNSTAVEPTDARVVYVQRFDLGIPAGPGAWLEEDPEPIGHEVFREDWLRAITRARPEDLALAIVDGDSMSPLLLTHDQVLVDTTQQSPRDGIYALRLGGQLMLKRITVGPGQVDISSDNKAHKSYDNVPEDELHIMGRVVWLGRKI